MFTLRFVSGPLAGQTFPVESVTSIGRWGTDIIIQDPKLSRRHGTFEVEGHQFLVRDHDSTNGTLVNGAPLAGAIPLSDGDVVTMGESRIEVAISEQEDAPPASERFQTQELSRPAPVVVSGVAKPRGLGIIAAAVVVAIGLGIAAFAFLTSEEVSNEIAGRGEDNQQAGSGSSPDKVCARSSRSARGIHAARPAARKAWMRDVRQARRIRARTLAALVTGGLAEDRPAFVASFRRTDSSLLRLQNALRPNAKSDSRAPARRRLVARSRVEQRLAERAGLSDCGGLAL